MHCSIDSGYSGVIGTGINQRTNSLHLCPPSHHIALLEKLAGVHCTTNPAGSAAKNRIGLRGRDRRINL
jgi:hypothetical protein